MALDNLISIVPRRYGAAREVLSYVLCVARYLTAAKVENYFKREWHRLRRSSLPGGYPYHALVDVCNVCNLQCPYCPTGRRQNSGRAVRMIDVDLVRRFLDGYGRHLIAVDLFNWGESLLHPHIADIVKLFHDRHIFIQISSNLNIKNRTVFEDVIDAGLDRLLVSISGTTQSLYERYHRGGDISLVIANLKSIIEYRRRMRYSNPVVELKYLTFNYNLHDVDNAYHLANDIGVDIFLSKIAGGDEKDIIKIDTEKKHLLYPDSGGTCDQLWRTITLNSDGGIAPCCFLFFKADDFLDFSSPENGSRRYIEARNMFKREAVSGLPKDLQHPCLKCSFVHRQKHLAEYLAANPNAKQGHRTGGP